MYAIHISRKLTLITEKSCLLGIMYNREHQKVYGGTSEKTSALLINRFLQIISIGNILNIFPHLSKGLLNKIRHT